VIKKLVKRGGHGPRWAAEPEKINKIKIPIKNYNNEVLLTNY
jgi:hypothetical protein